MAYGYQGLVGFVFFWGGTPESYELTVSRSHQLEKQGDVLTKFQGKEAARSERDMGR